MKLNSIIFRLLLLLVVITNTGDLKSQIINTYDSEEILQEMMHNDSVYVSKNEHL